MPDVALNVAIAAYGVALVTGSVAFVLGRRGVATAAWLVLVLALPAHAASIALRGVELDRVPLSNMPEALVAFAWATGVAAAALSAAHRRPAFILPSVAIVLLALGGASLADRTSAPLVPALRSNWLLVHVSAALIAYGAFACAFVADGLVLLQPRDEASAATRVLGLRATGMGFAFLTVGIATGAVWANQAWGDYWSWDPKEVFSLATWLLYGACLHLRLVRGWSGARGSLLSMAAFAAAVFTFLGVTYLLPSEHGYAR